MIDYTNQTKLQPNLLQQDQQSGVFVGHVVDVRDPTGNGKVRLQIYAIDGDYPKTDISALKWVDPIHPGRGAFSPPELGDRLGVSFEAGDRQKPIVLGHKTETPLGEGMLFWNKRKGCEVRPEGWHRHDLYPESRICVSSGNGNIIYVQDALMAESADSHRGFLASSISLLDTGGKYFRIKSLHRDQDHWSPVTHFPKGLGTLYKTDYGDTKPVRSGFETDKDLDQKVGSIEMGTQRLKRQMVSGEEDHSVDQVVQSVDAQEVGHVTTRTAGLTYQVSQNKTLLAMMDTMMVLAAEQLVTTKIHTPPKRWDN